MLPYSNSKVTLELRDLMASFNEDGTPFELWDFDYPSYYKGDEKKAFEQKVIDHFFFHQIGAETVARFKHNFKTRIREIMPYYLQMYKSVEIMNAIDDPFGNVDVTETFEQTTIGSSTATATSDQSTTDSATNVGTSYVTGESDHKFSNTPQGTIRTLDHYLTEASVDNKREDTSTSNEGSATSASQSSGTSSVEDSNTVTHVFKKTGNQGVNTYAHDMIEFRQSFINVDMMIIGELRDLFLLIY